MENTPPPVPASSNQPSTDNSLAVVMHLLGFAWFIFPFYGNIIAPLILWLVKRADSPLLDRVGKEVLNFQISFSIYISIAAAVGTALLIVLVGFFFYLAAFALWVTWLIFMIMGAVKTSNGEDFRYPMTIRILQ